MSAHVSARSAAPLLMSSMYGSRMRGRWCGRRSCTGAPGQAGLASPLCRRAPAAGACTTPPLRAALFVCLVSRVLFSAWSDALCSFILRAAGGDAVWCPPQAAAALLPPACRPVLGSCHACLWHAAMSVLQLAHISRPADMFGCGTLLYQCPALLLTPYHSVRVASRRPAQGVWRFAFTSVRLAPTQAAAAAR